MTRSAQTEKPEREPFHYVSIGILLTVAVAVIVVVSIWGRRVEKRNVDIKLGAPPLVGQMDWRPGPAILPAIGIALLVVIFGERLSARLSIRRMTALASVTGTLFTFALAASDGMSRILDPVVHRTEYWYNLGNRRMPGAGGLLEHFASREFLRYFSVHLKGHPPGFIILLKGLAAVGLDRPWVTGALSYLGVAMMISGVLVTTTLVVGESAARRCAPFLVLAPFSMWLGTSADAFYAGVGAVAVALVAVSLNRMGWIGLAYAGAAGISIGSLLFLTYAGSTFLAVPGLVTLAAYRTPWRRRIALIGAAVAAAAVVFAIFGAFGFWWPDGLRNTNWFYWHGTAQFRPWRFFLVNNLGAFLFAVGPAVLAGMASLRRTRLWVLVGAGLVCVSFATASQYSKGEVERIWVLFYPWMVPAVAVLPARRLWLAAQVTLVVVLQVWLVSKW